MFNGFLSFSKSLATNCMSKNNKQWKSRIIFVDLNPIELEYYPLVISLDKCNGSCNSVDDLSTKNMCSQ